MSPVSSNQSPNEHRAVTERRPGLSQAQHDLPQDGLVLERLGDLEVALDCYPGEVFLGPGQAVVHDVRGDHLYQEQGQVPAGVARGSAVSPAAAVADLEQSAQEGELVELDVVAGQRRAPRPGSVPPATPADDTRVENCGRAQRVSRGGAKLCVLFQQGAQMGEVTVRLGLVSTVGAGAWLPSEKTGEPKSDFVASVS